MSKTLFDKEITEAPLEGSWIKFKNTEEQLAEMASATHGYIIRYVDASGFDVDESESDIIFGSPQDPDIINEYWLVPDDPLREMKKRQAFTGQPVWARQKSILREGEWFYLDPTTEPPWFIKDAEFSFRPFQESENVSGE